MKPDIATYISYLYKIKHLYNIQIQKYIKREDIIKYYYTEVQSKDKAPPGNRVGPYYSSVIFFYSL